MFKKYIVFFLFFFFFFFFLEGGGVGVCVCGGGVAGFLCESYQAFISVLPLIHRGIHFFH